MVLTAAGVLYAIQRKCPHEAAPLERGQVWDKMIRCGQHAFTFDLETGEGLNCPGYSIERYAVTEEDGKIFLRTDANEQFRDLRRFFLSRAKRSKPCATYED